MENKSARAKVQAFGGFLTAMVIPNIGAFIAWGFITALFIPTGWLPNEHFAKIVGPMITYLLPVMIGSTGGHLVGGKRGGFSRSLLPARAGSSPAPHGRAQITRSGGQTGKGGELPPFSFLEARHDKTRPTCSGTGCSVVGAPSVALCAFRLNGVFGHKPGDGGDGDQRPVRIGDADVIGPQIPA